MFDEIVLILKSLAVNFPILRAWGYSFPRVITVVTEPGRQVQLMDALINFPANFDQAEKAKNSDFVFYYIGRQGASQMDVEAIKRKMYSDRKGNQGLPLIVTDNPVVADRGYDHFFIFLGEYDELVDYTVGDIVPFPAELKTVRQKLSGQTDANLSEEERILRAGVYFLEPYCYRNGKLSLIEELLKVVHQLCVLDEEARDTHDLEGIFIKALYDWQRETGFSDLYELGNMDYVVSDVQKVMFFDDEYVYVSEKLFKEIAEPTLKYIPINTLKKGLFDSGVIDTGNDNATTYTVKVGVVTQISGYSRARMMRLKREKLEVPGMIGIVDACYFAKGGDCDEQRC